MAQEARSTVSSPQALEGGSKTLLPSKIQSLKGVAQTRACQDSG